jgi:hypothetical protein
LTGVGPYGCPSQDSAMKKPPSGFITVQTEILIYISNQDFHIMLEVIYSLKIDKSPKLQMRVTRRKPVSAFKISDDTLRIALEKVTTDPS